MNGKHICILGGSGFVGHHLASLLVERGFHLRIPTRRREDAKDLLVLPTIEVVETDIQAPDHLVNLFEGMDAVINLIGILHEDRRASFKHVHAELPREVLTACRTTGIRRLLHMSALGADNASQSAYQRSKAAGEARVLAAQGMDLDVTVFRPSVIYGPGDSFLTLFADLLGMAPVIPLADASARFQPVYVGDVARAFADALDDPSSFGQRISLCGPGIYTLKELVELTGQTLGLERTLLPLGESASYWFARLMELKPGRKLMTRDNHYAMLTDNVCPSNCTPQPTALETVIGYLREAGPRRRYTRHRSLAGR